VAAKLQVAKNTFVKQVASSVDYPAEVGDFLKGQTAVVTGDSDVCASAKVLKTYGKEIKQARDPLRGPRRQLPR
jgi:large subunit ribosomal protein L10